jgi:cytochrome c
MALFPGLPDAKQRADVIVFLRTKNDNPPPLPEATAGGGEAAGGEEKPGGEKKPSGEKPAGEAAAGGSEVIALLATADPKQGEADAALCKVCHTFDKGGAALVGPNLYDVVGRKIASLEGFNYTPALKAHEGAWTYELLDPWITNPQAFAPGTMMAFPGIPEAKKRANVIAFMRSKSDNPAPLPEGAAAKPTEAAPAEKPAEAAPAAEPPAPPAAETPAAPAEKPAEAAPAAEPPVPPAETPAPPTETAPAPPAAETPAPPAETPAPPAEAAPEPSAETPAAPAETPPAATEEPAAAAEEMEKVIKETEDNPPTVSEDAPSEPSAGEPASPSQPQPVYPDGKPEGVE